MKLKYLYLLAFLALFSFSAKAQTCTAYGYYAQSGSTVTFYDTSYSQNGHSTYWSFGDGTSGYGSTVTKTYNSNGTFTPCFVIYDSAANCTDTLCFSVTISSASGCNADFSYSTNGRNVVFTDNSTSSIWYQQLWNFGDGSSTTTTNSAISHTYTSSGSYNVCLYIADSVNVICDSICKTVVVNACYPSFSFTPDSTVSNRYCFYGSSPSTGGSAQWVFVDGNTTVTDSGRNVCYTFVNGSPRYAIYLLYDSSGNFCDSTSYNFNPPASCYAYFYAYQSRNAALTMDFYNASSGSTNVLWNFGDGSTSTSANPSHTYSSAGTYNVCLYLMDSVNQICDSSCQTITVTNSASCYGSFSYAVDSLNPYKINFTNTSVGASSAYWWFGGSNSSTAYNPSFTYSSSGWNWVCLTTYDSSGNLCDSICDSVYVPGTSNQCYGSFTMTVDSVNPLKVYFTNTSVGATSAYWWFGGNNSSTVFSPTFTFNSYGNQTVCLTTYDSSGNLCDSICQNVFLRPPSSSCQASFTSFVDSTNNLKVHLFGSSPPSGGSVAYYIYEGGASTTYNSTNVTHTFNSAGSKTVVYVMFDSLGYPCDTVSQVVSVTSSCQASFYLAVDTNNLYNLYIINNSTGTSTSTSYYWDFGDSSSSTQQSPTHQYTSFGVYNLCLTISDSLTGCTSTYCDSIGLDSNGNLLKREGFTITVLDAGNVSVEEFNLTGVNLYPNPSTGLVNISLSAKAREEMTITTLNALGQEMSKSEHTVQPGDNKFLLDLSDQKTGMYFIKLQTGNGIKTQRVFIKHN